MPLLDAVATFSKTPSAQQYEMMSHAMLVELYETRGMREEATKHCQAIGAATPADAFDRDFMPIYGIQPVWRGDTTGGSVTVEIDIDTKGFPINPRVIDSKGPTRLERLSLEAVEKFRYAPKYESGEPVIAKGIRYKFRYLMK